MKHLLILHSIINVSGMKRCFSMFCIIGFIMQLNGQNVKVPEMVFIKGGTFIMGNTQGKNDEKPEHRVSVSDFYIGKFEVTIKEFREFVISSGYITSSETSSQANSIYPILSIHPVNYARIYTGDKWQNKANLSFKYDESGDLCLKEDSLLPVIYISYNDASSYCRWLSKKANHKFRLPTEAEWEYAASSGGKCHPYTFSNDSISFHKENIAVGPGKYGHRLKIGSYSPNLFGLYDMGGNVREWCFDAYYSDMYKSKKQDNPRNISGSDKIIRGGSWFTQLKESRITYRNYEIETYSDSQTGFRIVEEK